MSRFMQTAPGWVKLILALGATLISVTLAYAQLKTVDTELRGEINLLKQQDTHTEKSLEEIKQMLQREFERHHPRR